MYTPLTKFWQWLRLTLSGFGEGEAYIVIYANALPRPFLGGLSSCKNTMHTLWVSVTDTMDWMEALQHLWLSWAGNLRRPHAVWLSVVCLRIQNLSLRRISWQRSTRIIIMITTTELQPQPQPIVAYKNLERVKMLGSWNLIQWHVHGLLDIRIALTYTTRLGL